MNSKHPFEPFIPNGAKKLIIGSIPPPRFCIKPPMITKDDVSFYYGSKDNDFWRLISKIFKTDFLFENTTKAINQRKEFLTKFSIGITDLIEECNHKNNSAADSDLEIIKYKKIKELLIENESVEVLIYTSNFVKKQMNNIFKTFHSLDKKNSEKQSIKILNKTYQVRILYSPSPQALRNLGKNGSIRRQTQYEHFLINE